MDLHVCELTYVYLLHLYLYEWITCLLVGLPTLRECQLKKWTSQNEQVIIQWQLVNGKVANNFLNK